MYWNPYIEVAIKHDFFDVFSLIINIILGVTALYSLWISRNSFKKSEFDSAMNTSPSIVIRPKDIFVGVRDSVTSHGYGINPPNNIIRNKNCYEIMFAIDFEFFNAGRGTAFNLSQIQITGMDIRDSKVPPLYLTLNDEPHEVRVLLKKSFEEALQSSDQEIPVCLTLFYTNDQNNIYCKSTWRANIKPFEKEGENLKVSETRLFQRSGKIEYSQKPFV